MTFRIMRKICCGEFITDIGPSAATKDFYYFYFCLNDQLFWTVAYTAGLYSRGLQFSHIPISGQCQAARCILVHLEVKKQHFTVQKQTQSFIHWKYVILCALVYNFYSAKKNYSRWGFEPPVCLLGSYFRLSRVPEKWTYACQWSRITIQASIS